MFFLSNLQTKLCSFEDYSSKNCLQKLNFCLFFFFQHRVSLTIPLCFLFIKIAIFPIHGLGTVRALFGLRAVYRHTCTRARVIGPADKSKRLSAEDDVDPRVDNRVSGGHLYTK